MKTTTRKHHILQQIAAHTRQQHLSTPTFFQIPRWQWGKAAAFAFFCMNSNFQSFFLQSDDLQVLTILYVAASLACGLHMLKRYSRRSSNSNSVAHYSSAGEAAASRSTACFSSLLSFAPFSAGPAFFTTPSWFGTPRLQKLRETFTR